MPMSDTTDPRRKVLYHLPAHLDDAAITQVLREMDDADARAGFVRVPVHVLNKTGLGLFPLKDEKDAAP
jgi:hypothetical protein